MINSLLNALICKRRSESPPKKRMRIESECPICYKPSEKAVLTQCGHYFCSKCIDVHLDNTQTCPICRTNLRGSLLYPSRALGSSQATVKRVQNGLKYISEGSSVQVKDSLDRWWIGKVKCIIPNGDDFPSLLISYKSGEDIIELIPQDSARLAPYKSSTKDPEKKLQLAN